MATRNSKSASNKNTKSAKSEIMNVQSSFMPLFNSKLPIQYDDAGIPIRGTALLIYQGMTNSIIEWEKNGNFQEKPIKKFVFAVKATSGQWQAIDISCSKWNEGNLFDRLIKSLGATDYINHLSDGDEDGFDLIQEFDFAKVHEQIEEMRGIQFTAEMSRFETKRGGKLYRIEVDTLKPLLSPEGELKRRQAIDETNPNQKTITVDSEE